MDDRLTVISAFILQSRFFVLTVTGASFLVLALEIGQQD
jgi:membrane-associated phospholipid phosphatase